MELFITKDHTMNDFSSDLKKMILESKNCLYELEERLQKAESWMEGNIHQQFQEQEELGECVSSLSRVLEKLQMKIDASPAWPASERMKEVRGQLEESCNKALGAVQKLETEFQKLNSQDQPHADRLVSTEENSTDPEPGPTTDSEKPTLIGTLMLQARESFDLQDYEECVQLLHSILNLQPLHPEAAQLLPEVEKKWEDQQMADEMAIHLENIKKEAINLFDQSAFEECIGKFEFLCELDPGNPLYLDFIRVSREELALKQESSIPNGEDLSLQQSAPSLQEDQNISSCPIDSIIPLNPCESSPLVEQDEEKMVLSSPSPCPREEEPHAADVLPTEIDPAAAPFLIDGRTSHLDPIAQITALQKFLTSSQYEEESNRPEPIHVPPRDQEQTTHLEPIEKTPPTAPPHSVTAGAIYHRLKTENSSSTPGTQSDAIGKAAPLASDEEQMTVTPENMPWEKNASGNQKRNQFRLLAIAALFLLILFPAGMILHRIINRQQPSVPPVSAHLIVNSLPEGADIYLDGTKIGVSNLKFDQVIEGRHSLRLEREGCISQSRDLEIRAGQTTQLLVQLESLPVEVSPQENLQASAHDLLNQKHYYEAYQKCNLILKQNPEDETARQIRDQIRQYYLQTGNRALTGRKWEEARATFEIVTRLFPQEKAGWSQLKLVKSKLSEQQAVRDSEMALKGQIQELEQKVVKSLNAPFLIPPHSNNTLELSRQLQSLDPSNAIAGEALNRIRQELTTQVQQKIQQHDREAARELIAALQTHFVGSPEISHLTALLKSEDLKQQNQMTAWLQKAEGAMIGGHFVAPSQDNVILYSNRLLSFEEQNAKAASLKLEAFSRAIGQARNLIRAEKYEEARDIFAALLAFSSTENGVPLSTSELKNELGRLEFHTWPVIHDHTLGSCTGQLQFNGYVISFTPQGDSKDGFNLKLSEVSQTETGDRFRIQFKNKTYRFQINHSNSREESREKLNALNQQFSTLLLEKGTSK
jgi:tetratricopeptide (TPR) repeat protein